MDINNDVRLSDEEVEEKYKELYSSGRFPFQEIIFDAKSKVIRYRMALEVGGPIFEEQEPYGNKDIEQEKKKRLRVQRIVVTGKED